MDRSRARARSRLFEPEPPPAARPCDRPGCTAGGEHRAPKARDCLNEYYWFCLEHVREYNKAWDFYAGLSERDIEAALRADVTWQRPTWPLGGWRTREREMRARAFGGAFGRWDAGGGFRSERADGTAEAAARPASAEESALALFGLAPPVDFARIKARYRELVKRHHPDANGGDRASEEMLKRINEAYNTLKAVYPRAELAP